MIALQLVLPWAKILGGQCFNDSKKQRAVAKKWTLTKEIQMATASRVAPYSLVYTLGRKSYPHLSRSHPEVGIEMTLKCARVSPGSGNPSSFTMMSLTVKRMPRNAY